MPGEDDVERGERRNRKREIDFALSEIGTNDRPQDMRANTVRVRNLLRTHPELAETKVLVDHPSGGGKTEIPAAQLLELHPDPTLHHKNIHKGVRQWTVRKSGSEYVLSAR